MNKCFIINLNHIIFSSRFFLKSYICIYGYASNTYLLPNFLRNLVYALTYAFASTYPFPFPCNIGLYAKA